MKTEYYGGIPVDVVTYQSILKELPQWFESNKQLKLTSINPQIISLVDKYPEILIYIENSDYRLPDGIGIVKLSKLLGGELRERVTGIELMILFINYASKENKKVFLFGSKVENVAQAATNIKNKYKLADCDYIDGYTSLTDEEIVQRVNDSQADFLFVGLGFPLQEKWLAKNSGKIKAKVVLDVGGSFDVLSGAVMRAPYFFRYYHLEWLYRSFQRPKRFMRIMQVPLFLYLVFKKKNKQLKNGKIK
ncbi:WecB/TagA/CpsF family glycosyltransferase [Carnobacterium maltaromaticum]|uniref:WecB/TagA/CpsF family glycosyltransferase n=1 Tax=Carnobacterium maltaromaticum TaxID=2751 RepID=UPI003B986F46